MLKTLHQSEKTKLEKDLKSSRDERKTFETRYKEISGRAEELVKVIHEKDRELEEARKRVSTVEEDTIRKLDLMKKDWEINIKGKLEFELKDMLTKLMEEKKQVEAESERVVSALRIKENEVAELRNIINIKVTKKNEDIGLYMYFFIFSYKCRIRNCLSLKEKCLRLTSAKTRKLRR